MNTRVHSQAPLRSLRHGDAGETRTALIVSSQRLFREALRRILEPAGIEVIADGASVADVLDQIGPHTWPDIGICSIDGQRDRSIQELSAIGHAFRRQPRTKWAILSESPDPEVMLKAAQIGVHGFLLVDISAEILLRAIELVILGQKLFPAEVTQLLSSRQHTTTHLRQPNAGSRDGAAVTYDDTVSLSQREDQILQCLVAGHSNKAIARELEIAEATVKVHIKALLRKVKVANRTQAAIWALNRRSQMSPTVMTGEPNFLPAAVATGAVDEETRFGIEAPGSAGLGTGELGSCRPDTGL